MAIFVVDSKAIRYDQTNKLIRTVFYADAATDWEEEEFTIVDMPTGYEIWAGSWCYTADGNLGIFDSTGVWNWLGSTPDNLSKVVEQLKEIKKGG